VPETDGDKRASLINALREATERANAASLAFDVVMGDIPSGTPYPDGVQRIKNVSRELSAARAAMMKAHIEFNNFLGRGIGPKDLD